MKIVILTTQIPFVFDGAALFNDTLAAKLRESGHSVEINKLPFKSRPAERILDHILAARFIQLWGVDQVIALGFPAYFVRHEKRMVWLLHQFRQAYELWQTAYQEIPDTPEGTGIRTAVVEADTVFLREAEQIFAKSKMAAERLWRDNGVESEVLYPPLVNADRYRCGEFGDYILCAGGAHPDSRQLLAIAGMKHVRSGVRLVVVTDPGAQELQSLKPMVERYNLGNRVQVITRPLSQEENLELYANARGCIYVPYAEDGHGYATLESFQSRKPVIACTDSGATLELVENGATGLVVAPDERALADGMDRLIGDLPLATRLGQGAYAKLQSLDLSWAKVVQSLVQ